MCIERGDIEFILPSYPYNHFAKSLKKMQVLKHFFVPPREGSDKWFVVLAGFFPQQKVLFTISLPAVLLSYLRRTVYLF